MAVNRDTTALKYVVYAYKDLYNTANVCEHVK